MLRVTPEDLEIVVAGAEVVGDRLCFHVKCFYPAVDCKQVFRIRFCVCGTHVLPAKALIACLNMIRLIFMNLYPLLQFGAIP
ncbi:conserved hypothetical protein [Ricinus communis]|uniref:Uncharacterized protein n=1 Tax=Ricinus communis TaxID=3988 RepID=B9SCF2_RICCO|nr:conserved hypothetical protein [Ricinus communis]